MEVDYSKVLAETQKHEYLYHYTSRDSLEAILLNQSFRLSRLDLVNDPCENNRIKSVWNNRMYVGSFTNTLNNEEYFWNTYGKKGVRIGIRLKDINLDNLYFDSECKYKISAVKRGDNSYKSNLKDEDKYIESQDWGYFDSSILDVQYVPNIEDYTIGKEETNAGLVKEINGCDDNGNLRKWDIESETRIRVALKPKAFECYLDDENEVCYPKPNFEYIYLKLSGVKLDITEYSTLEVN